MAYDNSQDPSQDGEFDPEVERILHEHFDVEGPDLRSPTDPWTWLQSRMEDPAPPPFFSRFLGGLNPLREFRVSPAFAGAAVAVVAVAVVATVWAVSGDGDPEEPSGQMAAMAPTETRSPVTPAPKGASAASDEATENKEASPTNVPAPADRTNAAVPPAVAAPTSLPLVTPTVAPMPPSDSVEKTEKITIQEASSTPAPRPTTIPGPTAAPQHARGTAMAAPTPAMAAVTTQAQGGASGPWPPPRPPRPIPPLPPTVTPGGQPADTTFQDYQRQPFVDASVDSVSTFSLDTDRTSYHLALNWARSGYEIDPDSVRAEEWINAFDYGLPPPPNDRDFAISTGVFPHLLDDDKLLAQVSFQAPELEDDTPLNVTLVLDASGSMADGNRVAIARQAAESIRQSLRSQDRIAVVHFTDYVIDRYTVDHRAPDDSGIRNSIHSLQPHGSTNVQAGLNLGVRLADDARRARPDAYNYVILMSDGVANVDATDPFAILETAYDANARNPLRLIAIGVGVNNYNDVLLEQLAQHGNGWYRYLNDTTQAEATFTRDNWLALSTPFADQTRAQVTWDPDVVARWRIIGYENRVTPDETFSQDLKKFAEIYSGASVTVFYELELNEVLPSGQVFPFESVALRWVDPATRDSRSILDGSAVTLAGWSKGSDFGGHPRLHLGAIVALAADRYSLLSSGGGGEEDLSVHQDMSALLQQLRSLRGDLGTVDAYNDFLFLLEHMTGDVEERLPPSTPSGYSR